MTQQLFFTLLLGLVSLFFLIQLFGPKANRVPRAEAHELVKKGAVLLDVRTPGEYQDGHLKRAKNIPLHQLGTRLKELATDQPIIVYCRSGARSARAARILAKENFEVKDLGPMSAW